MRKHEKSCFFYHENRAFDVCNGKNKNDKKICTMIKDFFPNAMVKSREGSKSVP